MIAYGEISAFERLAEDAKLAPTLEDKIAIASMAATEFGHVTLLQDRLTELGTDPFAAMAPFQEPLDLFHAYTAPSDWYEGLIKAYVGDGLAADFYREIAAYLDPRTRDLILASLTDAGHSQFVIDRVRRRSPADPRLGGRLALWGRRLMGEALTQAQRVAAERDAAVGAARRRRRPARARPGGDRPDVHPDHRAARRADGRARPRLLSAGVRPGACRWRLSRRSSGSCCSSA